MKASVSRGSAYPYTQPHNLHNEKGHSSLLSLRFTSRLLIAAFAMLLVCAIVANQYQYSVYADHDTDKHSQTTSASSSTTSTTATTTSSRSQSTQQHFAQDSHPRTRLSSSSLYRNNPLHRDREEHHNADMYSYIEYVMLSCFRIRYCPPPVPKEPGRGTLECSPSVRHYFF